MAQCIARAPGGPTHVLLDDRIAEHVPGCNMAFRRDALLAIGGFNPIVPARRRRCGRVLAAAGARLEDRLRVVGARLAPPSRRPSRPTGGSRSATARARRWLMAHHPEKFLDGHMLWRGRIYSPLPFVRSLWGTRINAGVWGTAAFPSVYRTDVHPFAFLPHSVQLAGAVVRPDARRARRRRRPATTRGRRRCCSAPARRHRRHDREERRVRLALGRRFAARQPALVPRDGRLPALPPAVRARARAASAASSSPPEVALPPAAAADEPRPAAVACARRGAPCC